MQSTSALRDGIRRVNSAPALAVCVFVLTLVAALPLGISLGGAIRQHLGNSMAGNIAADGVNLHWWREFIAQAGPVGKTFEPTIIGFAAVLDNLSAVADNEWRPSPILWAGAFYLLLWLFLAGGILDRYARARPTRTYEFFAACGVYFVRFLRLAPLAALFYYALFGVLHPLLFTTFYEDLTRDVVAERTAFLIRLALYAVFGVALVAVNILFDYAKVRAVVEDRRSMIGAIFASWRFVRRNFRAVAALYFLNTALFVGVAALYAAASFAAGAGGTGIVLGVIAGQLYVFARIWVKLVFFGAETSLFQARLAHAGYVASAAVPRPVPPAVERLVE